MNPNQTFPTPAQEAELGGLVHTLHANTRHQQQSRRSHSFD